jgi:hypothetical protein
LGFVGAFVAFFFAPCIQKHTRTLAAVAPAEAGSNGSTMSVVWKEETLMFVRDRVRVERTFLGDFLRGVWKSENQHLWYLPTSF